MSLNRLAIFLYHIPADEESAETNPPHTIIVVGGEIPPEELGALAQARHATQFASVRHLSGLRLERIHLAAERIFVNTAEEFTATKIQLREQGWYVPGDGRIPFGIRPWDPVKMLAAARAVRQGIGDPEVEAFIHDAVETTRVMRQRLMYHQ